jgi:hypothetical protein
VELFTLRDRKLPSPRTEVIAIRQQWRSSAAGRSAAGPVS